MALQTAYSLWGYSLQIRTENSMELAANSASNCSPIGNRQSSLDHLSTLSIWMTWLSVIFYSLVDILLTALSWRSPLCPQEDDKPSEWQSNKICTDLHDWFEVNKSMGRCWICMSSINCDLLKNVYLCSSINNVHCRRPCGSWVVICLKISIFA